MGNLQNYKDEIFDIILQGGQSNAEGCGSGFTEHEYQPDKNILYMNNVDRTGFTDNYIIETAEERIWDGNKINDFSLSFAKEYQKKYLKDEHKILIIRAAVGGTGWRDNRWGMTNDLYLNMMRMIKVAIGLNPMNKLKVFLWHQGETDAGTSSDIHYNHLSALVNSVRETYNYKELPFIAGDFVNEWKNKNLMSCEPTIAAIRSVCDDLGGAFIKTSDLESNNQDHGGGDDIHFSRNSLNILGKIYFEAYDAIVLK